MSERELSLINGDGPGLENAQPTYVASHGVGAPGITRSQSIAQGWSGHVAQKLIAIQRPLALVLLLSGLFLCAAITPESDDDKREAATKPVSPHAWALVVFCFCLLGIGCTMKILADRSDNKFGVNDKKVLVAWIFFFTPLLFLELAFYIRIGWKVILIVGSCCAGSFCLAFIGCLWTVPDQYHIDRGRGRLLLFSAFVAVAAVPPVVTLFWTVGRSGIAAVCASLHLRGLRIARSLHYTGFIWALYCMVLLYALAYFLRIIVYGVSKFLKISDVIQKRNTKQLDIVSNRWKNVYLVGWTLVALTQIVATIWSLPQVFELAPSFMMIVLAPQIPLIAAHHLMPFRFAAYVANVQMVLLVSSAIGLAIAVVQGDRKNGLLSPVVGGNILATIVTVSVFAFLILITQIVDCLHQTYVEAKGEERRLNQENYFASLCQSCHKKPVNAKSVDCGHVMFCMDCASAHLQNVRPLNVEMTLIDLEMSLARICPRCHSNPVDAKNTACGHIDYCWDCAMEIRAHDGEICTTCRTRTYLERVGQSTPRSEDLSGTYRIAKKSGLMSCLALARVYRCFVLLYDLCKLRPIFQKLKEPRVGSTCVSCKKEAVDVVNTPCMHVRCCLECTEKYRAEHDNKCPVCDSPTEIIKIMEQDCRKCNKPTQAKNLFSPTPGIPTGKPDQICVSCSVQHIREAIKFQKNKTYGARDCEEYKICRSKGVVCLNGFFDLDAVRKFLLYRETRGDVSDQLATTPLSEDEVNILERLIEIPEEQRFFCRDEACGDLNAFVDQWEKTCKTCNRKQCLLCSRLAHPYGMTCGQVIDGRKFVFEYKDASGGRCPNCHVHTTRFEGLEPYECSCGHRFCYTCLQSLKPGSSCHNPKCSRVRSDLGPNGKHCTIA